MGELYFRGQTDRENQNLEQRGLDTLSVFATANKIVVAACPCLPFQSVEVLANTSTACKFALGGSTIKRRSVEDSRSRALPHSKRATLASGRVKLSVVFLFRAHDLDGPCHQHMALGLADLKRQEAKNAGKVATLPSRTTASQRRASIETLE